jgi:hypothetical protein
MNQVGSPNAGLEFVVGAICRNFKSVPGRSKKLGIARCLHCEMASGRCNFACIALPRDSILKDQIAAKETKHSLWWCRIRLTNLELIFN